MREVELAVRRLVFAHFARTGRALTRRALADRLGHREHRVIALLAALADERVLVLDEAGEIEQALPFCGRETEVEVRTEGVRYFAGCPWAGYGVAAVLGSSATISMACGACGESLAPDANTVFHLSVPARRWWADIRRTQKTTLGFCSQSHLELWLEASGEERGESMDAATMETLGARWYGRHLDADWTPRDVEEQQAILSELGLTSSFWQLVMH